MKIAIVNQKGGTGKTTTSIGLAKAFSEQFPTILVDLDPLAGATLELLAGFPDLTVADLLAGRADLADALVDVEPFNALRLIAGSPDSDDMEDTLNELAAEDTGILRLRGLLDGIDPDTVVVMDCPAGLNSLSLSAIIAADLVVVAAMPEPMALAGARKVMAKVADVRDALGSAPTIVGVVATRVQRTRQHADGVAALAADGSMPFLGAIPQRGGVRSRRLLADDYAALADGILARLGLD